ncbi:MAG: cytochrome c [Bacteriovoracaceae bacterium]|nr:cytochrome c [Bacteriovoracaceae bacterium]
MNFSLLIGAALVWPLFYSHAADDNALIERGRRVYLSNCISCHNKDPNKKGSLGPEMVDAPLEIMMAKVMTGRYPEVLPAGFIPKRKTKSMRPLKKLEKDIPAIHAWVQSQKKKN